MPSVGSHNKPFHLKWHLPNNRTFILICYRQGCDENLTTVINANDFVHVMYCIARLLTIPSPHPRDLWIDNGWVTITTTVTVFNMETWIYHHRQTLQFEAGL